MTRPRSVRYLRTEPSMAFPAGRLLVVVNGEVSVLAPDGWTALGRRIPPGASALTRTEAEDWCERQGLGLHPVPQGA